MSKSHKRERDLSTSNRIATRPRVFSRPSPIQATPETWPRNALSTSWDFDPAPSPAFDQRRFDFAHPFSQPAKLRPTSQPRQIALRRPASGRSTVAAYQRANATPWASVAFSAPANTIACIRRKRRKQVLFAKRLTKRGRGTRKRFNSLSSIGC